jgi:hypothetical protein
MAPSPKDQEWYYLAEQASKEMNPEKLWRLISQLCQALEKRQARPEKTSDLA